MRKYECMYIIRPDLEEARYAEVMEKFTALIEANGGELVKIDPWGKKRLAYEIDKVREGFYVLMYFNANPELPAELERNFRISDEIMRYLVISLEEE